MTLSFLDWSVIGSYFAITLAVSLYFSRRAKTSTSEFFLSGRNAPWWLAGTSMVATTFAADTPLLVTGLVAKNGIAGNWLWWCMVMSGIMTVFFYARMWRRAGVLTDVEFAELRYSGKPAAFLRGFRALYLGVPVNCIILGWVNLAMLKILTTSLNVGETTATAILAGILLLTAFYTTLAGLWGVYVTDMLQFTLQMSMAVVLAYFAVQAAGGMDQLAAEVQAADGQSASRLDFLPPLDSPWMPAITFCTYLGVVWWSSWYPGAEPGGGGYVAQRIFSARNERHGVLATLWFNVAHYALRPWPWIVTALATLVLYPELQDKESGYVLALMDPRILPPALRGFMLAGFAAAYMSTISTQLNWGASYVVNDFYRRFIATTATERHYVVASQITTVLLMLLSLLVMTVLPSIEGAWKLLLATGAGTGGVYLLRWYWWRINAWSEVSALVVAAATSVVLQSPWGAGWNSDEPREFAYLMLTTTAITTAAWMTVTLLTPVEPEGKLVDFYRRVRPIGPGWSRIAKLADAPPPGDETLGGRLVNWLLGCTLIYTALFGIGHLIFGRYEIATGLLATAGVAAAFISRNLASAR